MFEMAVVGRGGGETGDIRYTAYMYITQNLYIIVNSTTVTIPTKNSHSVMAGNC